MALKQFSLSLIIGFSILGTGCCIGRACDADAFEKITVDEYLIKNAFYNFYTLKFNQSDNHLLISHENVNGKPLSLTYQMAYNPNSGFNKEKSSQTNIQLSAINHTFEPAYQTQQYYLKFDHKQIQWLGIKNDHASMTVEKSYPYPTIAKVGESGQLFSGTVYANEQHTIKEANQTATWEIRPNDKNTAYLCQTLTTDYLMVNQKDTQQTLCLLITRKGEILKVNLTLDMDGKAMTFSPK